MTAPPSPRKRRNTLDIPRSLGTVEEHPVPLPYENTHASGEQLEHYKRNNDEGMDLNEPTGQMEVRTNEIISPTTTTSSEATQTKLTPFQKREVLLMKLLIPFVQAPAFIA